MFNDESSEGTDADPWAVPKFTEGTNVSRDIPRVKTPIIKSVERTSAVHRAYRNDITKFFFKWRRRGIDAPSDWDGATMARRVKARINKIPIKSSWKGPGNYSGLIRRNKKKIADWGSGGPRDKEPWAMARSQWLANQFLRIKMRHIKTLGWGGLGVVNLFEQERPDGQVIKVVCKIDIDSGKGYLRHEIEAHKGTAGAKHISQRIPPGYFARPNGQPIQPAPGTVPSATRRSFGSDLMMMMSSGDEAKMGKGKRRDQSIDAPALWDTNEVLFLEFMSRGDLRKIVAKISAGLSMYGNPPPLTLWHIFGNLFKGVVGLAYPRVFMPEEYKTPYMSDEIVPQASESCMPLPKLTPYCEHKTLVHFDLDMSNVLVGDYDSFEHNATPIAKIADLGLCHPFLGNNDPPRFRWSCRRRGKRSIFAPEQFTEEWDYVKDGPLESGAKTAGNYNWWTNLYQVGIIMYSLITLCEFEVPPTPNMAEVRYPDGSEKEVWGYGMDLLVCGYSHIDFDLVNAVAACLCHDPADRPDLHDLETLIRTKITSQPPDGPATKQARDWGRQHFEGAPPPWYQPATTGRERLYLWQKPAPGGGGGGPPIPPAVRQPGVQAGLAQQRTTSLATPTRQKPAAAGRGQQRAASVAVVPGQQPGSQQQPGFQAGRGQQRAASGAVPPGQQSRFPAGRGQQPSAQAGWGQPPMTQAGRGQQPPTQAGRGQPPQFPAGRGQKRAASAARGPGLQRGIQAGRGRQPSAQAGRGQPPQDQVSATADRWRQAGFPTGGQHPSALGRTSRTHFQGPSGFSARKGG
ncbi:hypothetical protein QR685DRAFT_343724 [Neurospora intermedia]|uniref:Protein kinase domain-containing protein n=1 Tax=Neurospora intermedia TaxID=5142 RepID=A0ABR3D9K2_NEUIN